jgi:hypothetical protein
MNRDWNATYRLAHARARIEELTALREEIRLARAARPPVRLRRRLGTLLIAAGQRLVGPPLDAPSIDGVLAGLRKG